MESESISREGRPAAIAAYLTIIGTIIAFFMNNESKNPFASYHIRQGLGVHITFYMLGMMVSWFDSWLISFPFYIFIVVLWGYGIIGAIQGDKNEAPILGKYFQEWFNTIN